MRCVETVSGSAEPAMDASNWASREGSARVQYWDIAAQDLCEKLPLH